MAVRDLNYSNSSNFIESFCGEGGFQIWDVEHHNIGVCFQKSVLCSLSYSLLAVCSVFYVGKRTPYFVRSYQHELIVVIRLIITLFLFLLSILEPALIHFYVREQLNLVDFFSSSVQVFAWMIHLLYLISLRHHISRSTRGPRPVIAAWVLTLMYNMCSGFTVWVDPHVDPQMGTADDALRIYVEKYVITIILALQVLYLITLFPQGRNEHFSSVSVEYSRPNEETPLLNSAYTNYGRFYESFDPFHLGVAEEGVNKLSHLTFYWVNLLMEKGSHRLLNSVDDLYALPRNLRSEVVSQRIQKELLLSQPLTESPSQVSSSRRSRRSKYRLLAALYKCFGRNFFAIGVLKLIGDSLGFAAPLLLHVFIDYVDGSQKIPHWKGYSSAVGLCVVTLLSSLFIVHFNYLLAKLNIQIRASLISTIYRKVQTVNLAHLNHFSPGQIVNMMSTDTDRVVNFCQSFHAVWSLPLQLVVTLILLYREIGVAFVAGVVFAILLIPINRFLAVKIGSLSVKMMKFKDRRINLMNDILNRIKDIKFNSWENLFKRKIMDEREEEVSALAGKKYLDAACVYFWATSPVLIPLFTFATYVLLGNEMLPARVFTAIALFNMLITPLNAFPWVINGLVEAWVSIKRIENLMQVEDYDYNEYYTIVPTEGHTQAEVQVLLLNSSFSWGSRQCEASTSAVASSSVESSTVQVEASSSSHPPHAAFSGDCTSDERLLTLNDINLQIKRGQVTAIVGGVGSGKTALLLSILGEIKKCSGVISVASLHQGFGLATQNSWLQNISIKDNIVFGSNFDPNRYKSVIKSCALEEDLESLPKGDETRCGENGGRLSGGQRARVALARAVYQNKSLYLLDDIFSNLDGPVASQIMDQCIHGLLSNRTIILVTHHVHLLSRVDWVVQMVNGAIHLQGVPGDVLPMLVLKGNRTTGWTSTPRDNLSSKSGAVPKSSSFKVKDDPQDNQKETINNFNAINSSEDERCSTETRSFGELNSSVYTTYIAAFGVGLAILLFFAFLLMQSTRNLVDTWLAKWVSHSVFPVNSTDVSSWLSPTNPVTSNSLSNIDSIYVTNSTLGGTPDYPQRRLDPNSTSYLIVYVIMVVCNSLFSLLRAFLFAYGGICAAKEIHKNLLESVIHSKMEFFDLNPVGRILNRFSTDVFTVDDALPFQTNIFFAQIFGLVGALAITIYGLPWVVLLYIPLMFAYYTVQQYYRHTSRDLRRIYALSLSPMYSHFTDTLLGLPTIRAMRASHRFSLYTDAYLEQNQRAQFGMSVASQWLNLRLQLIGLGILVGVVLLAIWQHHVAGVSAGLVGLVISYSLAINANLNGVVTSLTETERELISVERVNQYLKGTTREGQTRRQYNIFTTSFQESLLPSPPPIALPHGWPHQGQIVFSNVYLKYQDHNPYCLRDVSFTVSPLEKIGIVGRTGAGKSSLLMALFRLVEISRGSILIDNVDISELSIKKLRSSMAIVSQDVLLFSGTVRENVDPRQENLDQAIRQVLDQCGLTTLVQSLGGLDAHLEGGKRLSAGEIQLFGLARALLSRTKIVCLDEGTALLDVETETKVQAVIREAFRNKTVIVIAHKMFSIKDCHRVIVMDDGEVAEVGRPQDLLDDAHSLFYSIVHRVTHDHD